jgi:hypothetical protein
MSRSLPKLNIPEYVHKDNHFTPKDQIMREKKNPPPINRKQSYKGDRSIAVFNKGNPPAIRRRSFGAHNIINEFYESSNQLEQP